MPRIRSDGKFRVLKYSNRLKTSLLPMVRQPAANATVSVTNSRTEPWPWVAVLSMLRMIAKRIHPTRSLTMADPKIVCVEDPERATRKPAVSRCRESTGRAIYSANISPMTVGWPNRRKFRQVPTLVTAARKVGRAAAQNLFRRKNHDPFDAFNKSRMIRYDGLVVLRDGKVYESDTCEEGKSNLCGLGSRRSEPSQSLGILVLSFDHDFGR
jgi:hypothetical protein